MNDHDLERLIHERLRSLPELRAPEKLIPGVLQQIAARQQQQPVWWRRPWLEWPRGFQVFSVALLALVLGGAWYLSGELSGLGHVAESISFLKPVWTLATTLAETLRVLISSIRPLFLVIGATVVALLYFSTLACGTLCYRIAAGKRFIS